MRTNFTQQLKKPSLVWLGVMLLIGMFVSISWLHPGIPETDDANLMILRATGFHESFMDGHVPVRWIQRLNENYGYPVTNFLYPLPFYIAEIFQILGFTNVVSIKLLFIFATITAGIGMFLVLKQKYSSLIASIGGFVFISSPYFLSDLYSRGSLGEVVALAIAPFVFLSLKKWLKKTTIFNWLVTALLWSLLIPAHNSLALLFSLVFFVYILVQARWNFSTKLARAAGLTVLVSLLSVWFWFPALYDLQFTRSAQVQISEISSHLINLPGGIIGLLGPLTFSIIIASFWRKVFNKETVFWLSIIGLILLLQDNHTALMWKVLALDKVIQFPFRFLSIVTFATPLLLAKLLSELKNKKSLYVITTLIVVGIAVVQTVIAQQQIKFLDLQSEYFLTNFDSTTNQKEFTPIQVHQDPQTYATSPFEVQGVSDKFQVNEFETSTQETYVQLLLDAPVEVIFNTHYFPGWQVFVDDQLQSITTDEYGRILVSVSNDQAQNRVKNVKLIWNETPIRQASNLISLVVLFAVCTGIVFRLSDLNKSLSLGIMSLTILIVSVGSAVLFRSDQLKTTFDPKLWEKRYLESQWVDPQSTHPIGDYGLYLWAGWAYVHGENPILINPEMPPLGKYLIGIGLLLTNHPAVVGLFFSLSTLASLFLLSKEILKDRWLAVIPLALFSLERIYRNSIVFTMLDQIQLTFLILAFYFFLKAEKHPKWLILACLALGGVLSSKFFATGLLISVTVGMYYLVTKRFNLLKYYVLASPLIVGVHLVSYWKFFLDGYSLRNYLGTQKWILEFYQSGSPSVPIGSYWRLVFLNQWRVWWGPAWGEYYVLKAKEWNVFWPVQATATFIFLLTFVKKLFRTWIKSKSENYPSYYLLISWLGVYSLFLTMIGGWPHYMLLFLPFSSILLVQFILVRRDRSL